MRYFETIVIGLLVGWFIVYPTISQEKSKYKYLDLPEEFNQIKAGDTINVYQSNDTIFIRFIPKNYSCNTKTIVTI